MDLEARDATQSSVLSTASSGRYFARFKRSLNVYQKSLAFGVFLSLLIHTSAFYGIYIISKKVFEVINSREKVFRFTLLGEIPGEKKTAVIPFRKSKKSLEQAPSTERVIEKQPEGEKIKASDSRKKRGVLDLHVFYPRISRVLGEEGEVVFLLESHAADLSFKKLKSSGFWRLDQAAEKVLLAKSESFFKATLNEDIDRVRFVFKLKQAPIYYD